MAEAVVKKNAKKKVVKKKEKSIVSKSTDAAKGGIGKLFKSLIMFILGFFTAFFKNTRKQNIFQVIFVRSVFSLAVIMGTFNPYGACVLRWVKTADYHDALTWIVVAVTIIAWSIVVGFAYQNLKQIGMAFGLILYGLIVWLLQQRGIINVFDMTSVENTQMTQMAFIVLSAVLFGFGMSWTIIKRRWIGVIGVEDHDGDHYDDDHDHDE